MLPIPKYSFHFPLSILCLVFVPLHDTSPWMDDPVGTWIPPAWEDHWDVRDAVFPKSIRDTRPGND